MVELSADIFPLMAALGIGLLIGIERERRQRPVDNQTKPIEAAGVRSFALVSLTGHLATWLPQSFVVWGMALGFVFVSLLSLVSYWRTTRLPDSDTGITSEVVLVTTYILGILTGLGYVLPATVSAVVIVTLLYFKDILHRFSYALSTLDVQQAVQFLIVTIVILPVLPNRTYGPYEALNPHQIWLMVVLISGLGFAGYAGIKILGDRIGLGMTGLLGGLASSTAVTLAMSRISRSDSTLHEASALAIILASGIMFPRVLILVSLFAPATATLLLPTVIAISFYTAVICLLLWRRCRDNPGNQYRPRISPLSLRMALGFGALYGVVVFFAHFTQTEFGDNGILTVATLSGLTDVDAISLSAANMVKEGLSTSLAAQVVLSACSTNTLVKLALGFTFAAPGARLWLLGGLLPMAVAGLTSLVMV